MGHRKKVIQCDFKTISKYKNLNSLIMKTNRIAVYSSVVYTRSNSRMRDFMIRNSQTRTKDNPATTPEGEVSFLTRKGNYFF